MTHTNPRPPAAPAAPVPAEMTDADLEAVAAGKQPPRGEIEGSNGWFVPLPVKLRRRR